MMLIDYLIFFVMGLAFGYMLWESGKNILLTLKLNRESEGYDGNPKFNYYICSLCGHKCRLDGWPMNRRYCSKCGYNTLNIVPPFRTTWRQLEEVTNLYCEKCEIPLRIGSSTIYCPYCEVHNPYELYVKGDDSEPVIARKVIERLDNWDGKPVTLRLEADCAEDVFKIKVIQKSCEDYERQRIKVIQKSCEDYERQRIKGKVNETKDTKL